MRCLSRRPDFERSIKPSSPEERSRNSSTSASRVVSRSPSNRFSLWRGRYNVICVRRGCLCADELVSLRSWGLRLVEYATAG